MSSNDDSNLRRPRRVTASEVAQEAGVSRSAVSRAFTPGAYLDGEKRKRIQQVAERLGYQPNALAAGLKGGRSHLVAIFVGNMRSPFDTAYVSHLIGRLNSLNKWPILIDGRGDGAMTAIEEVLRYPLDALIVRGGSMPEEVVTQCARFGIPMISAGRPIEAPGVDNVCCRNAAGTGMITRVLLERGRRRFGFVAGPAEFYSSARRRAGVLKALEQAGLPLIAEAQSDYTVEGGHAAARELLRSHRIDALICANDAAAIGALSAAQDCGLSVPAELSVVGFDDIAMAGWPMFRLTTVHNPVSASVEEILKLLDRRLQNPTLGSETVFVDPYVVARDTH